MEKINDMEDNLHFDQHEWIEKAKEQLDRLTHKFQSTVFTPSDDAIKEDEIARLTEELNALRQEIQALKA